MTYRAVFKREPDARWTVEIPKVKGCHSYGRTIGQARDRIREALTLFVDNAESARIEEDIRLPAAAKGAVSNAQQMRQRLEEARTRVSAAEGRAVRYLRKTMKLGHRDAGSILGLSHQRVHQLEQKRLACWNDPATQHVVRRDRSTRPCREHQRFWLRVLHTCSPIHSQCHRSL
jgi:predicted RNase H-like HicB family nuclease